MARGCEVGSSSDSSTIQDPSPRLVDVQDARITGVAANETQRRLGEVRTAWVKDDVWIGQVDIATIVP